jgi:hypothetical protein
VPDHSALWCGGDGADGADDTLLILLFLMFIGRKSSNKNVSSFQVVEMMKMAVLLAGTGFLK